jgi:hypothetical protein
MRHRSLLASALLLAFLPAAAEVGVFRDAERPHLARPYVQTVFDVVDEPDPFGIWARHSPLDDTRRAVLNPDGNATGDGWPAVIYHAQWQRPMVAWSTLVEGSSRIVLSEFVNDAWTAPRPVSPAAWDQYDPVLAVDPAGLLVLSYWATNGSERLVFAQYLASPDEVFSPPIQVSETGQLASRPGMTYHAGIANWVYELDDPNDGSDNRSVWRTQFVDGGFVHELVAPTNHPDAMWPQVHSHNGRLWVDWIDFTAGDPFIGEMAWQQLEAGNWSSVSYEPFANEEELDYHVRGSIRMQVITAVPPDDPVETEPPQEP